MPRPAGCRFDASERCPYHRPPDRRRLQHRGPIVERHHGDRFVRRRRNHDLAGAFAGKRHLPRRRQAQRPIDDEDGDPLHPAGRVQKRPRKGEGQQQQRRNPQRQQQQLAQSPAPVPPHERAFQEAHIAERQPRRPVPREEVQEDRHRSSQRAEQERGKEKRHQRRLRVARYSRSAASSGCTVCTWQYSMPASRNSRA